MNLILPWSITCACCDSEIDCEVRITSFIPGLAEKTFGLPEDCYPEENSEVEFTVHRYDDGKEIDAEKALSAKDYNRLVSAAIEYAAEDIQDSRQMASEAAWEARTGR